MSNRTITENLEYFISNTGVHLNYGDGVLDIDGTGVATINNQPILSGLISSSPNINVGPTPNRALIAYFPRFQEFFLGSIALTANTPLDLDWNTATNPNGNFAIGPSPGVASTFVQVRAGATTHFEFPTKGIWIWTISAAPTVTLGNTQELKLSSLRSVNSGGAFFVDNETHSVKGGAGTPSVDNISLMNLQWISTALATGVERVKFNLTCTENKTVNVSLKFHMLNPSV